jgi:hypothetical protein
MVHTTFYGMKHKKRSLLNTLHSLLQLLDFQFEILIYKAFNLSVSFRLNL